MRSKREPADLYIGIIHRDHVEFFIMQTSSAINISIAIEKSLRYYILCVFVSMCVHLSVSQCRDSANIYLVTLTPKG